MISEQTLVQLKKLSPLEFSIHLLSICSYPGYNEVQAKAPALNLSLALSGIEDLSTKPLIEFHY